jgi:hypothetical protein
MKAADVLGATAVIPVIVIAVGASVAKAVAEPAVPIAGPPDQVGLKLVLLPVFAAGLAVRAKLAFLFVPDSVTVTVQFAMLVPTVPVRMMLAPLAVILGGDPSYLAAMLVARAVAFAGLLLSVAADSILLSVAAQPVPAMAMVLTRWVVVVKPELGPMKIVVVALEAPAASGLWTMEGVATDADPKG